MATESELERLDSDLFPTNKVSAWNGLFARLATRARCQLGAFLSVCGRVCCVSRCTVAMLVFVRTQTSGTKSHCLSLIHRNELWAPSDQKKQHWFEP